jgi:hypothetical protein
MMMMMRLVLTLHHRLSNVRIATHHTGLYGFHYGYLVRVHDRSLTHSCMTGRQARIEELLTVCNLLTIH